MEDVRFNTPAKIWRRKDTVYLYKQMPNNFCIKFKFKGKTVEEIRATYNQEYFKKILIKYKDKIYKDK